MVDIHSLPPNFCIGHYIPTHYWPEKNCPDDGYVEFILDMKRGYNREVRACIDLLNNALSGFDAVAVVPSHKPDKDGGIQKVAVGLAKASGKIDATSCLHRHKASREHESGVIRSIDEHLNSISLQNREYIQDKHILLLDDIRTTGHSLAACQQILEQASPQSVVPLAFAQTWYPDGESSHPEYLHEELSDSLQEKHACEQVDLDQEYEAKRAALEFYQQQEWEEIQSLKNFVY